MNSIISIIVCSLLYQSVNTYRILGVFPAPSKSHYYVGQALMQGLAEKGHEVTIISPFKEKSPIKNYNEVFLENSWEMSRKSEFLFDDVRTSHLFQFFIRF